MSQEIETKTAKELQPDAVVDSKLPKAAVTAVSRIAAAGVLAVAVVAPGCTAATRQAIANGAGDTWSNIKKDAASTRDKLAGNSEMKQQLAELQARDEAVTKGELILKTDPKTGVPTYVINPESESLRQKHIESGDLRILTDDKTGEKIEVKSDKLLELEAKAAGTSTEPSGADAEQIENSRRGLELLKNYGK